MPVSPWRAAGLALLLLATLGFAPGLSGALAAGMRAVSTRLFYTVGSVAVPPRSADPVRDAILNVTSDFDELAHLLVDFMRGQPPEVRAEFQQFMAERATRSYPRLEGLLDWLLSLYKFAFPFLIISMVAKLSGGGGGGDHMEGHEQSMHSVGGEEHSMLSAGAGVGGAAAPSGRWLAGAGEAAPRALERGGSGGRQKGPAGMEGLVALDAGERGRALQRSGSLGEGRAGPPAPTTPMERHGRLPLHPAQLQGMRSQSPRQQEVHALVGRAR